MVSPSACRYNPFSPTPLAVQDAESGGIDLVLMPGQILTGRHRGAWLSLIHNSGVAFDASFSRLGHGKGYYDRFLSHYSALAPVRGWSMPVLCELRIKNNLDRFS